MKTTVARSGFVLPSIESVSLIELDEAPLSACALPEACFAVGTSSGRLLVFQSEGDLLGVSEFGSSVIGLVASGDSVVAATSLDGVTALQGETKWTVDVAAGCEIIVGSGDGVLLADGAGAVSHISSEGEILGREVHGEVTGLASNADGSVTAIAFSDGRLLIIDQNGGTLHDSAAADDDVETISRMEFRHDGVLMVCRDSLGMALDERPENRLECWHPQNGLIHTTELPSRTTSLLPTETGALVGCFDGSIIRLEVGSKGYEEVARLDYSTSSIIPWEDDLLVASWFNIIRMTAVGETIWSFEHTGLVTHLLDLDNGTIAALGEAPAGQSPAPIVILDPDSEPRLPEDENFDYEELRPAGDTHAGGLSEEELEAADAPPEMAADTAELMGALDEEMEILTEAPSVEADLLEDLSASARAINLPPIADAGDEKTTEADDDGTATILLDGSRSYDPDGSIESWAWQDAKGRVIGHTPQLNVRLPKGVHSFELTVTDDRGASVTAITTVRIL